MPEKFKNRYRIPSARLQTWDYGWDGAYFITICTKNKHHYFGDVVDGKMQLSHIGVLVDVLLFEIKNHTKNIESGTFIVMPNHARVVVILNNDTGAGNDINGDKACLVSTGTGVGKLIGQQRFRK